jgi:hypothetical protein
VYVIAVHGCVGNGCSEWARRTSHHSHSTHDNAEDNALLGSSEGSSVRCWLEADARGIEMGRRKDKGRGREAERQRGTEGLRERERGREGERQRGRDGVRQKGRGREAERERGREGESLRQGGREAERN